MRNDSTICELHTYHHHINEQSCLDNCYIHIGSFYQIYKQGCWSFFPPEQITRSMSGIHTEQKPHTEQKVHTQEEYEYQYVIILYSKLF